MPPANNFDTPPFNIQQILEFESIFPHEKIKRPEEYLKGGSRSFILNAASFFLGFKNQKSKYEDNKKFLGLLFGQENNRFANEINLKMKDLENGTKKVCIINPYSSLKLFETFFKTEEETETQSQSEFEVNIFKAYLAFNSEFTKKQAVASSSINDLDNNLKMPMFILSNFYISSDKINYNIYDLWVTQTIKAIFLFQFLEKEPKAKPLLSLFVSHFGCSTWDEYLKRFLGLTISAIQSEREAHTDIIVPEGDNFEENCAFIEKLIIRDAELLEEYDFLTLRAKPFYKVSDGVYRIIYKLFVVEKIFKGVYFILRDLNEQLPPYQKIPEIKSYIGNEFSEKILVNKILKIIYPDNCISFSGKELSKMGIVGEPDYYVRRDKDILLFESKDFLIPASVKESCNFSLYENEFEKKLYFEFENGKDKYKAIMQLIENIKRILKNEFIADSSYNCRKVSIYPVLITHDHQYDAVGLNYLLNYWFQSEIEILKEQGFYTYRIKSLVVVNLDCLIYNQENFRGNHSLCALLEKYINYIHMTNGIKFQTREDAENYFLSKLIPFSNFADGYFLDLKIRKVPEMLKTMGFALFK